MPKYQMSSGPYGPIFCFKSNGEKLSHLMTFVLVFMGSPERMKNPHLRARMAEALEALMPPKDQSQTSLVMAQ